MGEELKPETTQKNEIANCIRYSSRFTHRDRQPERVKLTQKWELQRKIFEKRGRLRSVTPLFSSMSLGTRENDNMCELSDAICRNIKRTVILV